MAPIARLESRARYRFEIARFESLALKNNNLSNRHLLHVPIQPPKMVKATLCSDTCDSNRVIGD